MFTIEDVAKAAGVSTATVSRVLNSSGAVSEKTRSKVLAVVKEHNYEPNTFGRGLRTNKTKMILVSLSTFINSFYAMIIKGIEDEADKKGYNVLVGANYDDKDKEKIYIDMLKNHLADGMIFMRPSITYREMDDLYSHYAVVQCCEYLEKSKVPFVSIDNKKAAFEVTTRLINEGHKRIAFIGVDDKGISAKHRFEGYRDALLQNKIAFRGNLVIYGNYGFRNAVRISEQLIKEHKPDAIFAVSDRMAVGAMSAVKKLGLSVPDNISIVGFDNIDLTYMVTPNLSTVSQNQYGMGTKAMEKIIDIIEGKNILNEVVNHKIVWRDSVKVRK